MDLLSFINQSPTAFHTVNNLAGMLNEGYYTEFGENESWKLSAARKGFVRRNDSSLVAFAIPKGNIKGFHIYAAHSDSPCFRIKENPQLPFGDKYIRLNTERYGSMILSSWMDRPLSIAGRLVIDSKETLQTKLINVDRDLCVIPNVAIHMNSDINKGYEYKPQNDMLPLLSICDKESDFKALLEEYAQCEYDSILGKDLFVYSRQSAEYIGLNSDLIMGPRLDDLMCVYAGAKGLLESDFGEYVRVLAIFDNEEVGSTTKQGAASTFLEDTLYRIAEALSYSRTDYLKLLSESFLVSADNAHGIHPAMPGKADPTSQPVLNRGIVLKFNGNQRYATDAYSAAYFRKICRENGIPTQDYSNNSDIPGGSTLGNISTSQVSIPTVDIGLAQFAMHSACETAGRKDAEYLINFVKAYMDK